MLTQSAKYLSATVSSRIHFKPSRRTCDETQTVLSRLLERCELDTIEVAIRCDGCLYDTSVAQAEFPLTEAPA